MSDTGNQAISFEVKNQLAKLLATENITMRHNPSAKTACFDVKERLLVLPVWQNISEDLYDMLVVHEVGHALYSPADKWLNAIADIAYNNHQDRKPSDNVMLKIKGYLNVVEDARIDKLQKRRYPGSKRNYSIGYKELNDKDFFGTQNKDINGMAFIDRANIYFKSTGILIKFTPEERVFIRRMENAETFEDVVKITDELYAFARAENKKQKEEQQQQKAKAGNGKSDDDMDSDDDMESDGDDYETAVDGETDEESDNMTDGLDKDETSSTSSDEAPTSETYEASEKSLSKIVNDSDVNYIYLDVPKFNLKHVVDDYTVVLPEMEKQFKEYFLSVESTQRKTWQRQENDTISYMIKEFEMRKSADAYARIATAKTGVIDTNKLTKYKFSDDIFKKVTTVPTGKNHGFVMFLDWSGSMTSNLMNTMKQLFSLTMFCKRVNIPFEVYLFRTAHNNNNNHIDHSVESNMNFGINAFKIRNILSSRMDINTLNKAYNLLWMCAVVRWVSCDRMDSTPLNQTILCADQLVNDFRVKNKVQIVNTIFLTDGASDYSGLNSTGYQWKKGGNKYIVRDNVTKKTYWTDNNYHYSATSVYLRILKDRTDCNLIGFFLYESANLNRLSSSGIIDDSVVNNPEIQKSWKENDYVGVDSAGYDQYYIIRTRRNKNVNDDLQVNSSMTKGAIARTFMKFSERKTINRVMLSKFMQQVATTSF